MRRITVIITLLLALSCDRTNKKIDKENGEKDSNMTTTDVKIAGAMKNVMWKGELDGIISLDTIKPRVGLYGIGPESYLTGELLINDGQSFVSRVLTDSTMSVEETFKTSAPFFVYAHVKEWQKSSLPASVRSISDINDYLTDISAKRENPFVFKITGIISEADIHIQNLPKGTIVSSPKEAHKGQTNYKIAETEVEIIGFYSTEHQGIFTHHDSFTHMHLISKDKTRMGHVDHIKLGSVQLYLPRE